MSKLFDQLDDETPASMGAEIGAALTQAMEQVSKSNEAMTAMLSKAITQALESAQSKEIVVRNEPIPAAVKAPSQIKQWTFQVHRDMRDLITHITAKATV